MTSKVCARCKIQQPLTEFRAFNGGKSSWCKACYRIDDRARYKNSRGDYVRKYQKTYRKLYPEKVNAHAMARYTACTKSTPKWLTSAQKEEIEKFYWLAKDCGTTSGQSYQVDHIVPLRGKTVCGLHVPWNLQVLPADINQSKGNR